MSGAGGNARSMRRVDRRPIAVGPDAVVGCLVVRNEVGRIGAVLAHHRALGVGPFLVVDNGSDDGTVERLLDEADVHVWRTCAGFRAGRYGAAWFEELLGAHACGRWAVIVDADELFVYPGSEERPIGDLCAELAAQGARAYGAVLLDLYADVPLADTVLPVDRSPLEVLRYFDRRWRHVEEPASGPYRNQVGIFGGVRRRLFGGSVWEYCLSKVPLVRFDTDTTLVGGQHWTHLPLAGERGAVLHAKLEARLAALAWDELLRGQRSDHDSEYHRYAEVLALDPRVSAYDPDESVRYEGTAHLAALGIIGRVADPAVATARAEALTSHGGERLAAGETGRAQSLLTRAAEIAPTAVTPVLRLAALHRATGDPAGAAAALAEAVARRPDDLDILGLTVAGPPTPPGWDDVVAGLPGPVSCAAPGRARRTDRYVPVAGGGPVLEPYVDAVYGVPEVLGPAPRPDRPWIGFVHGAPSGPAHLPPFARFGLDTLAAGAAFRVALASCRGLITFTEHAARCLRDRTGVEVVVVPPPVGVEPVGFDPDGLAAGPVVVQPGWWLARGNALADLVVPDGVAKLRLLPARRRALTVAIARAERIHDGWADDLAPLRATTTRDLAAADGLLGPRHAVVLADLYDANADPVVLACLAAARPVLVGRLPAVVELLGEDYPLFVDDGGAVAGLLLDRGRVRAAHDHLAQRRARFTPARFAAAVADCRERWT